MGGGGRSYITYKNSWNFMHCNIRSKSDMVPLAAVQLTISAQLEMVGKNIWCAMTLNIMLTSEEVGDGFLNHWFDMKYSCSSSALPLLQIPGKKFFSEQFLCLHNFLMTFMGQHHCSLLKSSQYHNSISTENNDFVTVHSEVPFILLNSWSSALFASELVYSSQFLVQNILANCCRVGSPKVACQISDSVIAFGTA